MLANMKLSGHRREDPQSQPAQNKTKFVPEQKMFTCNKCDSGHENSDQLEEHLDTHYEDGDFTCDACLFQSNKIGLLRTHLKNSPDEKFISKKDLVTQKNRHHKTYRVCDYFKEGKCNRSPCRYSHKKLKEGHYRCYECGHDFSSSDDMYKHRKKEHKQEICKKFLKNECDRDKSDCWFSHAKFVKKSPRPQVDTTLKSTTNNTSPPTKGFWKAIPSPVPPTTKIETDQLMTMIEEKVQKMMESFLERMVPRT